MLKLFHSLDLKLKSCLIALFGSAFLAFGLYHVHSFSGVTEGGVLGMTLLLDHWFHISPIRIRLRHEPRLLRDGMETSGTAVHRLLHSFQRQLLPVLPDL